MAERRRLLWVDVAQACNRQTLHDDASFTTLRHSDGEVRFEAGGGPMKAAGDALTSDFTFRIVDAPDEVVRPNWSCDVAYNSWNSW